MYPLKLIFFDDFRLRRARDVLFLLAVFLRAVFLRVVFLLLGDAFLRVVLRRRVVVFLLFGAAFRRATLLADFLLAILFIPFLYNQYNA